MRASTYSRVWRSSTIDAIPCRSSSCDRSRPEGPPPTIATCVRLMCTMRSGSTRAHQRVIEDRDRARPAGRGAADLVREARDVETVAGQRFEVVQLLEVAVADVAPGLVPFPDQLDVA